MKLFEARDVRKTFGPLRALAGASIDVELNEIAGLIGPNGSGKSTFLHTICGRTIPDSGSMTLLGNEVSRFSPTKRTRAGMAIKFQLARIYRDKTVEENLLLALQAPGRQRCWLIQSPPHGTWLSAWPASVQHSDPPLAPDPDPDLRWWRI